MAIPVNFSNVEDKGFDPLPEGTYDAVVFAGELKEAGPNAKNPGSQYISWEFNILDPEYSNRKVWLNSSLVEKALPMLMRFLKAVGYTEEELKDPSFEIDIDDITGRECRVVLVQGVNPNTQEANNSVKKVLATNAEESVLP